MRISLHAVPHGGIADQNVSVRDIAAFQKGDAAAGHRIVDTFSSLITSLAKERSSDPAAINQYIEAGRAGVKAAAKKFKPSDSHGRFQLFALSFIEKSMDQVGRPKGFFARLFGAR